MFDAVQSCYVLTLEGSRRRSQYMKQLGTNVPCRTMYILHNKGYKRCRKQGLCASTPPHDLAHAYYTAIQHALKQHHNGPILICEDDFTFVDDIDATDTQQIDAFVSSREFDVYNLGPFPIISLPIAWHHRRLFKWTCTHACIYSAPFQRQYVQNFTQRSCAIRHVDIYFNRFRCYSYYRPLCLQRFEATENSKEWGTNTGFRTFDAWTNRSIIDFTMWLKLDTDPKRGFELAFIASTVLPLLLTFVVCIVYLRFGRQSCRSR